jgi:hypothetical protein
VDSCALESCTGLLGSSPVRLAKTRQRRFVLWLRAEMRPHRQSRGESSPTPQGLPNQEPCGHMFRYRQSVEVVEICAVLGHYTACGGNSVPTFRDSQSVPSSTVKNSRMLQYIILSTSVLVASHTYTFFLFQDGDMLHNSYVEFVTKILFVFYISIYTF